MKTVLVISSFVSASQVGARVSAICLSDFGINPIVLPTTLLGRHPGWGTPGGEAVNSATLHSMWEAIKKQGLSLDAVLTGYMATVDQIQLTLDIISDVKSQNPQALILVDPIMGDNGRLYVEKDIASAMTENLVPAADIITPNLFEYSIIAGTMATTIDAILDSAREIDTRIIVSSMGDENLTGAMIIGNVDPAIVTHNRLLDVPNGTGDALAALFLAHILSGESDQNALQKSVSSVFEILNLATRTNAKELPLIQGQKSLNDPQLLPLQRLT